MKNNKVSKGLAVFVAFTGALVMLGWIFDISILKSILPMWISMKFSTAVCFLLGGITLYCIADSRETNSACGQVVLPAAILIIFLFMGTSLAASILGVNLKIEDLFINDVKASPAGWVAGRPSILTMLSFILVGIAGILAMLDVANLRWALLYIGWVVLITGGLAVLGYTLNMPLLYYDIRGWNNPMACHTAILFVVTGVSLIILKPRD
jgi:hypothetical protein